MFFDGVNSSYSKCSKILNTFLSFLIKKLAINQKCFSEKQTGETLIRLLLKKKSDLGLPCLSGLIWQATTVPNFRTFTAVYFGKTVAQ